MLRNLLLSACVLATAGCETVPVEPQEPAAVASRYLDDTPRLAILAAYQPEIDALLPSLDNYETYQVNGVTFYAGTMNEVDVVVFMTGISLVNASMNAQLVINHFNVEAILVSGVAGGVDPSLSFADVTVPAKWGQYNEMVFMRETEPGVFVPHPGLGPQFEPYMFMGPRGMHVRTAADPKPAERKFWYETDPELMAAAKKAAETVEFKQCVDTATCLPRPPKVVLGGNGVTGSIFQDNADFREYLFETFDAQVVEMETSAIATVAYANAIPYIGFRSLSDLAGGGGGVNEYPIFEVLAAENAAAFLSAFLVEYRDAS
ncbi:MAG: 5'-methylthioadenosine/S-adenosylhomocysteine nucleosidase [Henriciella sp.]|nr:5'-methylthioadenosine/S-adenosylhomocysteine nucleosidase [Henriciella sp.]